MKTAICPGSFDPVTSGHLNIIRRAAKIFDKLVVCVMVNAGKNPMFSLEERVELISRVTRDIANVEVDCSTLDDQILIKADGMPTYNMAVVVDDHDMGVTHVVRGDDHVSNTPKQILLYQALGFDVPTFGHVPMICGPDHQKLSKRHGARAVIEYEQDGLLPQALVNYLVRLGWSHGDQEIFSLKELVEFFDGNNLNTSPAAFDPEKLKWLNAYYLRNTPHGELAALVAPFLAKLGYDVPVEKIQSLLPMYVERASDLNALAQFLTIYFKPAAEIEIEEKAMKAYLEDKTPTFHKTEE